MPAAIKKVVPKAKAKDVGAIAMKALSGGVIENATVALKYALNTQGMLILVGMEYPRYLDQIWDVYRGNRTISAEEQKQIEAIQAEYDRKFAGVAIIASHVRQEYLSRLCYPSDPS